MEHEGGGFWYSTPRVLEPVQSLVSKVSAWLGTKRDDEWWLKLHEDRLAKLIRRHGVDSGLAATARKDIATRLEHLGRVDEARLLREEVVAAFRRNRGNDDPYTLVEEEWLAHNLAMSGLAEQARVVALHIYEVRQRDLGPVHKDTIRAEALLSSIEDHL